MDDRQDTSNNGVSERDLSTLRAQARKLMSAKKWGVLVALQATLPKQLTPAWALLADDVGFALGQLGQVEAAVAQYSRCFTVEPTHRRAASLAYQFYNGLMNQDKDCQPSRTRKLKDGFLFWIEKALEFDAASLKDLYRLGVFEAQIESRHDKKALSIFMRGLEGYDKLDAEVRERRHDLCKYAVKSLYAAARSAMRLGNARLARQLIFECIRKDKSRNHVQQAHKLALAGRACLALGELDVAERAFRKAIDASKANKRDESYCQLAKIERSRGNLAAASQWIESNIKARHRKAHHWRLLGDIRRDMGNLEQALAAYEGALRRDNMGKHLTLTSVGWVHYKRGAWGQSEKAFRRANEFRRRRYLSEHGPAQEGLASLARARAQGGDVVALSSSSNGQELSAKPCKSAKQPAANSAVKHESAEQDAAEQERAEQAPAGEQEAADGE